MAGGAPTDPEVETLIGEALDAAADALVSPGDWLSGAERRAAALEVRDARTNELDAQRRDALSPNAVEGKHAATAELSAEAVEVVHRIASDPGRLTRSWAETMIAALGEEVYVELVGVTACTAVLDTFMAAVGASEVELADPVPGEPRRERPVDVGDVGAWVAQSTAGGTANVSRSLSLVPVTDRVWVGLVQALYSRGSDFARLDWSRALSRPQVELVAARTTAELECFY